MDRQAQSPQDVIDRLVSSFDIEQIDDDLFRGRSPDAAAVRIFGGQVIGQAVVAAQRTTPPGRELHSLHAYFVRQGDPSLPILYRVLRDRDGKSFSSRRVEAIQDGEPVLNLSLSFHVPEDGAHHQFDMPAAPPPETLSDHYAAGELILDQMAPRISEGWGADRGPIEFRPVDPERSFSGRPAPPEHAYWIRAVAPLPQDPFLHRIVVAYASDMMLLATAMLPHGVHWTFPNVQHASLDHAVWLHGDAKADEWMLYVQDSPWAGGARGFIRGSIYTQSGALVASVAQETLFRLKR